MAKEAIKRSEEDKLTKTPLKVILGGKEYEVPILVIKDAREWRKKVVAMLSDLPKYANATTDDPDRFSGAVDAMLVIMPDQLADLFFAYAKDLDRKEIEETATEQDLAIAIKQVMEISFPLTGSLVTTMTALSQQAGSSS